MSQCETANMLSVTARLGLANWRQNIIHIGFVVIFLVFAVALHDRRFLNPTNLLNIFRQTAMIAVMAIVMTYVLSAGEIDLPVGAVTGLASVVTAMAIGLGGLLLGVGAGLATGIAVATFNGLLTTRVGIPSFLTTLAMMGIAKGVAMWISDTVAVPIISHACLAVRRRQHRPGPRPLGLDAGAGAKKLVV